MAKIKMAEVYKRLDQVFSEQMRESSDKRILIDYKSFSDGLRADDFITTEPTLKAKWSNAVSDGVIEPVGSKNYNRAFLNGRMLELKTYLSKNENVCVCVRVCDELKEVRP